MYQGRRSDGLVSNLALIQTQRESDQVTGLSSWMTVCWPRCRLEYNKISCVRPLSSGTTSNLTHRTERSPFYDDRFYCNFIGLVNRFFTESCCLASVIVPSLLLFKRNLGAPDVWLIINRWLRVGKVGTTYISASYTLVFKLMQLVWTAA